MFVLIYWTEEQSTSVMKEIPDLVGVEVGKEIDVPYNGKYYPGKLILRSGK